MGSRKRTAGFWATVGVEYESQPTESGVRWSARLPGRTDIVVFGRTKSEALASLKTAYALERASSKETQ